MQTICYSICYESLDDGLGLNESLDDGLGLIESLDDGLGHNESLERDEENPLKLNYEIAAKHFHF